MKFNHIFFSLLLAFTLVSCNKDNDGDNEGNGFPEYTVTIMSPSAETLTLGESFHIHVNFDEASNLTIHHVNVQIATEDGTVIYNMPTTAHVHEDSGHHEHHDDFTPDVPEGTKLRLTAKVWGFEDGISEESSVHEFTLN